MNILIFQTSTGKQACQDDERNKAKGKGKNQHFYLLGEKMYNAEHGCFPALLPSEFLNVSICCLRNWRACSSFLDDEYV